MLQNHTALGLPDVQKAALGYRMVGEQLGSVAAVLASGLLCVADFLSDLLARLVQSPHPCHDESPP